MDTKELALGEAEAWCTAQELLTVQTPETSAEGGELTNVIQVPDGEITCFTVGSWKEGDATSGVGWVLQLASRET
ncbi:unnamed protein product [Cochlearia groenlandica]